ncbi:aldo/keto reductase, partial [Streptomyces amritsarensis]|uniref:aldo/keto reductase n=1 Tax=Streptomyces amritsarensis TaxID=681158 RepID=UPI00367DCBFE
GAPRGPRDRPPARPPPRPVARGGAAPPPLAAIAEKHDRTVLELAIGWLSARPGCASVIAGATSPEQVRANAAAGERPLDAELLAEIDAIAPGVAA